MKLYIAAGRYVGTQAEAKSIDKGFTPEEVPTDKEGLIAYLNDLAAGFSSPAPRDDAPEPVGDTALQPPPSAPVPPRSTPATAITLSAVEEFILDHAKPGEVENIFACLGTRFHEMRKRVRVDNDTHIGTPPPNERVGREQHHEAAADAESD